MSALIDKNRPWYEIRNAVDIPSPALLVYPARIEKNIGRMLQIAEDTDRLRPHVKTYKMAPVIEMQMNSGIRKFKCSTIAEAELTARCGAAQVLLALQPVGPQIPRFLGLVNAFPDTAFSAIVDSGEIIQQICELVRKAGTDVTLWLDIDNGMHRTGVAPGEKAFELYKMIHDLPSLKTGGLHVYDGHVHDKDIADRKEHCDRDFEPVRSLADRLTDSGFEVPSIVAGGTPTFPIHARREGVETSPGTPLLWDRGYADSYPDLEFTVAAVLLARIVSKPGENLLCLDLGYKAVASEMPQPRVYFPEVEVERVVNHSEEHLVIETDAPGKFEVGDVVYGIPVHICPTVDRHEKAYVVNDRTVSADWEVEARKRKITI